MEILPEEIADALRWAPDWLGAAAIFVVALLLAVAAHRLLFGILAGAAASRDLFWRSLVGRTRRLGLLFLIAVAVGFAGRVAPLDPAGAAVTAHATMIIFILLVALGLKTTLDIWMTLHLRQFKLNAPDNLLARKHATQIGILRRVSDILITVFAISAVLMTFDEVRQYGISLLASAGAAGIIVGLALQPFLKNLFAGLQLAMTQPIRIDDALLIEGEWGNVEEITSTYVVVKIWDWRRLIVPLSYFIERPFQNWTREEAALIGAVILHLDYRAPVDAIRTKLDEVLKGTPLWDGKVSNVQVVDARQATIELRILATAKDAPTAWDLRCHVREEIIGFLQRAHPDALPRTRVMIREGEEAPSGG